MVARVAAGDLNKQVAAKLGLSEVTVKVHRAHAMRKMGARTLAHLLKMIAQISACRVCLFIQEVMGLTSQCPLRGIKQTSISALNMSLSGTKRACLIDFSNVRQ